MSQPSTRSKSPAAEGIPGAESPGVVAWPGSRLGRMAIFGTVWSVVGYGASQVLRFSGNLVLTRILFPEAFGVMAIVNTLMQGLVMFSDLGLGPSIIRHSRFADEDFYNTAWTLQVIRGIGLWLIGCLLAWPMAIFYRDPQLTQYILLAALTALITGFNSTKLFTANRDMRFAGLTFVELISQASAVVVMIVLAVLTRNVWSLVIGGLVAAAIKLYLSQALLSGPKNTLCWRAAATSELFRYGKWIFLSTIFTFLGMQSDRLIVGRLVSLDVLGVYSLAMNIVTAVMGVFDHLNQRVVMPMIMDVSRTSAEGLARATARSRSIILSVAAIVTANMILLAPCLYEWIYDPRYHDAGWMTQLLGFGMWFAILQQTGRATLLATDRTYALALSNAANFVLTLLVGLWGFWQWGIAGFIGGWALGNFASAAIVDIELECRKVPVIRQSILITFGFVLFCIVGEFAQRMLHNALGANWPAWVADVLPALGLSIVAGAFVYYRNGDSVFRIFDSRPSRPENLGAIVSQRHKFLTHQQRTERLGLMAQVDRRPLDRPVPDFLIIGAAKAGTTSLFETLQSHPQVAETLIKEPDFFSVDEMYEQGMAWYRSLFRDHSRQQLTGEASTSYTRLPLYPQTAARAYAANPKAKIIYITREPISRCHSQMLHRWHRELFAGRRFDCTPRSFLTADPISLTSSCYDMQLGPWREHFPAHQIYVTSLESLVADSSAELAKIHAFLGIPTSPNCTLATANVSRTIHNVLHATEMVRSLDSSLAIRTISKLFPQSLRHFLFHRVFVPLVGMRSNPLMEPSLDSNLKQEIGELLDTALVDGFDGAYVDQEASNHITSVDLVKCEA